VAARDEIIAFCDELLDVASYPDYGPMGLQVEGAAEVRKVVCAVSSSRELFERAAEAGAQMVLVHHGLLWDKEPRRIGPVQRERLRALFDADLSLVAYHLALDAHPEVGNNAILANALGCERHEGFGDFKGRTVGRAGTFPGDGVPARELFARVREVTGREPLVQGAGPELVRRIGIVSGSAASSLDEAAALGLDAFLTGEPREHVMADARELGIHFIAAGHYATETFGVRALGDWLAARFGIEHVFVDVPNPV
jgi:dinuclear metal center YbgI/SA1388 family protein